MNQGFLAERLGRYLRLVESERDALGELGEAERLVPRGTVLRAEQASARELYVVERGWLYSSILLPDGNRQILSIHLPCEFAGDAGMPWDKAPFTLIAATDAMVRIIDKAALRALFERHPRLGLLLYTLAQAERVALADRLASVGRTSAKARVAALICDISSRLRAGGEDVTHGIPLPLTQEEIGDATGLTAVHVNRMMRQLAEEGLIARTHGRVHILDETRLAGVANHIDRFATIDTSWLPTG
ncbi:Crp/Fnr family transcriptional regulator [Sphingomonas abietis]|uniref:Crp/Fnr family transcriptional regulator n=1 Tax=Sphingomonas abietis TaxID=3012344 RepID=A0ABY7NR02_9SPHN|nr:Crp/Fnr family transcriptional regulator [Sphingomonas abietis]WBO23053.1 Crp/Fnr family transcriptional regulator [Sphingomonas abietis]